MPLKVKINVTLRAQFRQKIGSERVKYLLGPVGDMYRLSNTFRMLVNTSNEVNCRLLWEIRMYNFSRIILERVFVGSIVNIRNECLFSGFMGNES